MAREQEKCPFQSADLLYFSGRASMSWMIRLGTCSRFSHVGIVCWINQPQLRLYQRLGLVKIPVRVVRDWVDRFVLFESTTLDTIPCLIRGVVTCGMQGQDPDERIAAYPGRVWRSRLVTPLDDLQTSRLAGLLLESLGRDYDRRGALLAGSRILKHLMPWRAADRSELFCVEIVGEVLKELLSLQGIRPGKLSPKRLHRYLRKRRIYGPVERI